MSIKRKIIIPAALLALLAAGCNKSVSIDQRATPITDKAQASQTVQNATSSPADPSQRFVDQSYYKNSYLISGRTLSAKAKIALTGFSKASQTLADGNTQITLKAQKAEYHDQQYTLRPGDQLYFIEMFLGDDDGEKNEEKNTIDDRGVVVDSQGNVVGQPQTWETSASPTPAK